MKEKLDGHRKSDPNVILRHREICRSFQDIIVLHPFKRRLGPTFIHVALTSGESRN